MMWPILTKGESYDLVFVMQADLLVQYEKLPAMFQTVTLWRQIILSVILNWIIGPFVSVQASSLSC
jgi:ACR3 family arsenite efflux pump ArsB